MKLRSRVIVGKATPDEFDDVAAVLRSHSGGWDRLCVEEFNRLSSTYIRVARYRGVVVGTELVRIKDGEFWIWQISIHEKFRRAGIGRKLIEEMKAWSRTTGMPVKAVVSINNVPAQVFFRQCGLIGQFEEEAMPDGCDGVLFTFTPEKKQ